MPLNLDDLSSDMRRLLALLDPEFAEEKAPGRELTELSDAQLVDAHDMAKLGLVEIAIGWRQTHWFSLTLAGRLLRAEAYPD